MAQYDPNIELWKPIVGFDKYFISNKGRVKSFKLGKENILNPIKSRYKTVTLRKDNVQCTKSIHRLVIEHFSNSIDLIKSDMVVDHKFGNIKDNSLENLQIISQRANTLKGNMLNKSGYVGVSWRENRKSWRVRILYNKKRITLGSFKNKEDAIELHKQFFKDIETNNFDLDKYINNRNTKNTIIINNNF
jgi:hypothetical protein